MASKKTIFGLIAGAVLIAGVGYYFINKRKTITKAPVNVEEDKTPEVEEVAVENKDDISEKKINGIGTVSVSSELIKEIEQIEEEKRAFAKVINDLVLVPENKNHINDVKDLLSEVAHKCILCFQFQPEYLEKIPKNEEQLVALLKITGTFDAVKVYLQEDSRLDKLSTKCDELNITRKVEKKLKRKKFYPA